MVDLLVLTPLLPMLGAGVLMLSSLLLAGFTIKRSYVRVVTTVLAAAVVMLVSGLIVGGRGGSRIALPSLYPSLLADSAAEIRWDTTLWPLGLSLSIVVGVFLLVGVNESEYRLYVVPGVLIFLSAGLAAIWSANPLTTIICWALYDSTAALGRIAAGEEREDVVRSLALGTGAGLLIWAGTLVAEGGIGSVQWALMPAGGAKMTYWMVAGLLRLGAYPLHLLPPRQVRSTSPLAGAFALSAVLGWGLWIRLALVSNQALPVGTWTGVPALLTLLGGGVLAWTAKSTRESRTWISVAGNGSVLLSVTLVSMLGEPVVPTMTLGAVAWVLGTGILFLGGGWDLSQSLRGKTLLRSIPSLIGALSLIGAPVTLGFVAESALLRQLGRADGWGWSVGFLIGQVFLVAAVIRWLVVSDAIEGGDAGPIGEIVCGAGLTSLAIALILVGIVPNILLAGANVYSRVSLTSLLAAPNLVGWLLWLVSVVLGGILAWLDRGLRPRISLWLDVVHDVVLLDWGYEWLAGALEKGFGLFRVVDDVLGGRGALLWAVVLLLILVLLVGG